MKKAQTSKKKSSKAESNKKLYIVSLLLVVTLSLAIIYGRSIGDTNKTDDISVTIDGNTLHPCTGNPADQCKGAPSIDFYPTGSEGASNPEYNGNGAQREIMGRITKASDKTITIKTTSGRLFAVTFPIDPINNFNVVRTDTYAAIGDMLHIDYSEQADLHSTNIRPQQIFKSSLLIKLDNPKTDPTIKKY